VQKANSNESCASLSRVSCVRLIRAGLCGNFLVGRGIAASLLVGRMD
jgi:hypothetical protein